MMLPRVVPTRPPVVYLPVDHSHQLFFHYPPSQLSCHSQVILKATGMVSEFILAAHVKTIKWKCVTYFKLKLTPGEMLTQCAFSKQLGWERCGFRFAEVGEHLSQGTRLPIESCHRMPLCYLFKPVSTSNKKKATWCRLTEVPTFGFVILCNFRSVQMVRSVSYD